MQQARLLGVVLLLAVAGCGETTAGHEDGGGADMATADTRSPDAAERDLAGVDAPRAADGADAVREDLLTDDAPTAQEDATGSPDTPLPDTLVGPDAVPLNDGGSDAAAGSPDVLAGDVGPAPEVTAPPSEYALLSLNLHCLRLDGTAFATNEARFAAVAAAAAERGVRAIAVQEACVRDETRAVDMLEAALEAATGEPWDSAWVRAHTAWEGTPDEAGEGLAVLAVGSLADVATLSYARQGALRRVAIGATVPALGGLRLWSVHLDYENAEVRLAQARETATAVVGDASGLDLVVAGDFNARESDPAPSALRAFGFVDLTDALSDGRIDHVLAHRGAAVALLDAEALFDGVATPVVSDHPGVLARVRPRTRPAVAETRIRIHADVGFGHRISVRGDTAPLDWESGWPARNRAADLWELVLTEIPAETPFRFKCLRDDTAFQTGPDVEGRGGGVIDVTPLF